MNNKENSLKEKPGALIKMCPFVDKPPSNECYCTKQDNCSIKYSVKYCYNKFSECDIYKEYLS